MRDHGVQTTVYLDIPRAPARTADLANYARRAIDKFLIANGPFFGAPFPDIRHDARTVAPDSVTSLHAKCIVIDDERALVTSANFTNRGQERNIEVGVLIHDPGLCTQLVRQWRSIGG
jgi:phosphatidylserine/phosphatidylglycerophosphate/cardiolipin synthase-like enzyme